MDKKRYSDIMNGRRRTFLIFTIKAIQQSDITHEFVVFGESPLIDGKVKIDHVVRVYIQPYRMHKLCLYPHNLVALEGYIMHNRFCYWVECPKHIGKVIQPSMSLRMARYISGHDDKAVRSQHKH